MSASQRISELLLEWEEARQQGRELTAEELCDGEADSSGIIAELRERIAAIRDMEQRLGMTGPMATPTLDLAAPLGSGPRPPTLAMQEESEPQGGHARPSVTIPGYEIVELIDQGGMGVVYRAVQTKLQRTVAIKM